MKESASFLYYTLPCFLSVLPLHLIEYRDVRQLRICTQNFLNMCYDKLLACVYAGMSISWEQYEFVIQLL